MSTFVHKSFFSMIRAGRYHTLTVNRISDYGLYLADEQGDEVLLPNRYVSLQDRVGDEIRVFVYHDSENRLVATTEHPKAVVGDIAFLEVVDKNAHGAFLDWGLSAKHLFLPNRNQVGGVLASHGCLVYVYEDSVTGRAVATMKLKGAVCNDEISVKPHQKVNIIVASRSDIGYRVVINNRHWGMLYNNQLFRHVQTGDSMSAYVSRITDDGRIDVSLQQNGYDGVKDASERLLGIVRSAGGSLPLWDGSSPEDVARLTQMSKKQFKRSLGVLLKCGKVQADENGIKIIER